MLGFGLPELLIIGGVLALLSSVVQRGSGGAGNIPTLVLREFTLTPGRPEVLVVRGRAAGLVGWMLTNLHLSDESTFLVTREAISQRSGSLHGEELKSVPLLDIASTRCRFSAPLWMLIVAAGSALVGVLIVVSGSANGSALLGFLLISAVLVGLYHLNKRLEISVESHGGIWLGVAFKPSAIEQVSVDLSRALAAVAAINAMIVSVQSGVRSTLQETNASTPSAFDSVSAPRSAPQGTCPACGTVAESPDSMFCANCGTKLAG